MKRLLALLMATLLLATCFVMASCDNETATTESSEAGAGETPEDKTDALAEEIAQNLQALVGTTEEEAPKAEPSHPSSDTTSKFANLQFGRNYDPNNKP